MQSHQSLCNRSIDASALGVWFDALRGLCGLLSRFGGVFVGSGRGVVNFGASPGVTAATQGVLNESKSRETSGLD